MAITVQYQPSATLLGPAANQAGYGQYAQNQERFGEQIRQFDESMDERQRQFNASFGEGQRQFDAQQAFRRDAMGLQANQFNAGLYDRGIDRNYDMLNRQIQREFAAQSQIFQFQSGMISQRAREEAQAQADERRMQNAMGMQIAQQRNAQLQRSMEADWNSIQTQWPDLDESQRQEVVSKFQDYYGGRNMPLPVVMPPDNPDPNTEANDFFNQLAGAKLPVDKRTGLVQFPRGFPVEMLPGYQQYERQKEESAHQRQLELDDRKLQNAKTLWEAEQDAKSGQTDLEQQQKAQEAQLKLEMQQMNATMKMAQAYQAEAAKYSAMHAKAAEAQLATPGVTPDLTNKWLAERFQRMADEEWNKLRGIAPESQRAPAGMGDVKLRDAELDRIPQPEQIPLDYVFDGTSEIGLAEITMARIDGKLQAGQIVQVRQPDGTVKPYRVK